MAVLRISLFTLLLLIMEAKLLLIPSVACEESYKIVCYLGSWANYRHGSGRFLIEDIDPTLCTHLIYGFAKLGSDNRIAAYDPYLDLKENWGLGAYERFNGLKERNPSLKTLIAIGGWNEGSVKYSQMAKNFSSRKAFVASVVDFVLHHGFDGLDMDWEYPANRGGFPEDKTNFVLLLKELKEAFRPYGLILSAAVSAGFHTVYKAYDVPSVANADSCWKALPREHTYFTTGFLPQYLLSKINRAAWIPCPRREVMFNYGNNGFSFRYLDFINLMTYDFHGAWETKTGHNAPLYPRPDDTEEEKMLTVDYAVRLWIRLGAPREKIILGIPFYGRSFTLLNPNRTTVGSLATGGGQAGPYTQENGMMGFNEICAILLKDKGWTVVIDAHFKAPYIFKNRQWIGFDDIESVAAKVNYINEMKLGGGMVWSLETDDFRGECEQSRYPLLTTVRMGLQDQSSLTSKTDIPTPSPLRRSTDYTDSVHSTTAYEEPSPNYYTEGAVLCTRKGYYRDPNNCKRFYICTQNMYGGFDIYWYDCAPGTVFSEAHQSCHFPSYVPECSNV